MRHKNLGKVVGHCPECFTFVGEEELNCHCSRCGYLLHLDRLATEFDIVDRQTLKQSAMARYYPGYSKEKRKPYDG